MFVRKFVRSLITVTNVRSFATVDGSIKKYTPRRALLYVPGNDERKLSKIPSVDADAVILDCEDGVAVSNKEAARITIKRTLDTMEFGRTEPIVRINSISSGLALEDLKVILGATRLPPTIMLPKVEKPSDFEWLAESLDDILIEMKKEKIGVFNSIVFIESALGLLNFELICRRAQELLEMGVPLSLEGVVFGSDDYLADIGAERTKDARELIYARQKVITVAKAFQMQAIDMVHIDFKDIEGLKLQSIEGAKMGFTGKQVIHPSQVTVVQDCFTPSPEKVEWATELIKAFGEHQAIGKGAFVFRNNMIDMPLLRQAQNIVQFMEQLKNNSIPAEPIKESPQ